MPICSICLLLWCPFQESAEVDVHLCSSATLVKTMLQIGYKSHEKKGHRLLYKEKKKRRVNKLTLGWHQDISRLKLFFFHCLYLQCYVALSISTMLHCLYLQCYVALTISAMLLCLYLQSCTVYICNVALSISVFISVMLHCLYLQCCIIYICNVALSIPAMLFSGWTGWCFKYRDSCRVETQKKINTDTKNKTIRLTKETRICIKANILTKSLSTGKEQGYFKLHVTKTEEIWLW